MAQRSITRTAAASHQAIEGLYLSDDVAQHPRCLYATVTFKVEEDGSAETATIQLEKADRDATGNITGRSAAPGITNAQLTAARQLFALLYGLALTQKGYV